LPSILITNGSKNYITSDDIDVISALICGRCINIPKIIKPLSYEYQLKAQLTKFGRSY